MSFYFFFLFSFFLRTEIKGRFLEKHSFLFLLPSLLPFLFLLGPSAETRHFGPSALFIPMGAAYTFYLLGLRFSQFFWPWAQKKVFSLALGLYLLTLFHNTLMAPADLSPLPSLLKDSKGTLTENLKTQTYWSLSQKIQNNPKLKHSQFLTDGDLPYYYLSEINLKNIWNHPLIDFRLSEAYFEMIAKRKTPRNLLKSLIEVLYFHADYFIHYNYHFDVTYNPKIQLMLNRIFLSHPKCSVDDLADNIYSLECLYHLL